ncbi:MAG: hypothetical protein ACK4R3_14080 [Aliihoeflea sp.]
MRYLVISACADVRSGKEFERGDEFLPEPDADQAERLLKAGCLRRIDDNAPDLPGGSDAAVTIAALERQLADGNSSIAALNGRIEKLARQYSDLEAEFKTTFERMTTAETRVAEMKQQLADGEAAKARVADLEAQLAAATEKATATNDGATGDDAAPAKSAKSKA